MFAGQHPVMPFAGVPTGFMAQSIESMHNSRVAGRIPNSASWGTSFSMRSRLKISSSRPSDSWITFELASGRYGDIFNSR